MVTFLLLLAVITTPFVWFILRMLRFTNETVGEDSLLYKERTYQFSASQYFGNFLRIANPVMVVMMFMLAFITSKAGISQQEPLLFIFPLFFLGFAGLFCFVIYFDWQYWTITRNVAVTFNPLQPSITVNSPYYHQILAPENVINIEQHESNMSRMLAGYGYYLFYTADGQAIRINNIFFQGFICIEFLERFFPNVPPKIVWHRLPWPTKINSTENSILPNFAD